MINYFFSVDFEMLSATEKTGPTIDRGAGKGDRRITPRSR